MRTLNIVFTLVLLATALAAPPALAGEAAPQAPQAAPAGEVMLRDSVTVNAKHILLGDLFVNAGDRAGAVVAYAPEPGKKSIFDARWLYRVARAYKLDWKPDSIIVQSVVVRESIAIGREEIEDHILAALIGKGMDPGMNVELSNRMIRLHVPGDASATIAVEDVMYEPRTQRFTAIIIAPAGDPAAKRLRLTGRAYRISEVPVLSRRLLAGEIITADDIKWIKFHTKRLQANTILDAAALIGKTPRRILRQDVPVRASDIRRPILVAKGSLVTMVLRRPNMLLTSQGKALENGSNGDTIRVTNTQSNTVIEATVIGTNKVTVSPTSQMAMN